MVRNEDILKDILLKMNYDPSKTLNENKTLLNEQSLPLDYYYYDKFGNLKTLPNLVSNYPTGSTPAKKVYPNITDGLKYPKQRLPGAPQLNIPAPQSLKTTPAPQLPKIDTFRPGSDRIYQADATYVSPQNLMGGGTDALKYTLDTKPRPPYVCQDVLDSNPARRAAAIWHCLPYKSKRATELSKDESFCEKSSCQGNKGYEFLYGVYEKDLEEWKYFHSSPISNDAWHWILPLGAAAITIMTGGVGGLVVAGVLELADIALYVQEKDYEGAGIGLAFSIIPGGMLLNKIPAVKKFTSTSLKTFLNKISKGLDLTPVERELAEQINKNAEWLAKNADNFAKITNLSSKILSRYTGKKLIGAMLHMAKAGIIPWKWGWRITALGGTFLTLLQIGKLLAIPIHGLDYRNVQLPDDYANLPEDEKKEVQVAVAKQIVEQSPEIQESAKKEVAQILNTSDEEKSAEIAVVLESLDSELDSLLQGL